MHELAEERGERRPELGRESGERMLVVDRVPGHAANRLQVVPVLLTTDAWIDRLGDYESVLGAEAAKHASRVSHDGAHAPRARHRRYASHMRVVSLVPAATEIACALGAEAELVAVTHDCDYPPSVRALPRVTRSTIPLGVGSREIDHLVREAGERGESTFHLDAAALREAGPELVLGQSLCRVCAVTLDQLRLGEAQVVPLDATSLEGVFDDVGRVARALRREERGERLVMSLRARLARVRERVAGRREPRVACLEWLDPLFNGGHWVPEQVAIAGGEDVLGAPGQRSREIAWDELVAAKPDVVVLMPCGFDARRALEESRRLGSRLRDLGARAHAVDGNAYFSRPGPRLIDGVELLAAIFHPEVYAPDARAIPV